MMEVKKRFSISDSTNNPNDDPHSTTNKHYEEIVSFPFWILDITPPLVAV